MASKDDAAFEHVTFIADRTALVRDADVVLAVQPPEFDVVSAMKEGAEMVYGDAQAVLVKMIEAVRGLGLPAAA